MIAKQLIEPKSIVVLMTYTNPEVPCYGICKTETLKVHFTW